MGGVLEKWEARGNYALENQGQDTRLQGNIITNDMEFHTTPNSTFQNTCVFATYH